MPRYDYRCEANGHVFEVTQRFTDEPVAFCPEDGSKAERQLSIPHVIYKGSGFYSTDYKNGAGSSGSSTSAADNSNGNSEGDSGKKKSGSGSSSAESSKSSTSSKSAGSSNDSKS